MLISSETPLQAEPTMWTSWNGNISHIYGKQKIISSRDDLASFVAGSSGIRAFGTSQSSADICAGTDSLADMNSHAGVVSVDRDNKRIRAKSGTLLKDLILAGEAEGWTLPCLPDNDAITIGGAIATGTHGTTGGGKPLGEYMFSCSLITADGGIREVGEGDPLMPALRCSLGLLGIMDEITMSFEDNRDLFISEEAVRDEIWLREWPRWLEENYFLRMLWIPHSGYAWVIKGNPTDSSSPGDIRPAPKFIRHRREVSRILYGSGNPAFTRISNRILRSLFFSHRSSSLGSLYDATVTKKRSSTLELAEWTIGQNDFTGVFETFRRDLQADKKAFAHIPMDIRFLNADKSWLSNAYGRDIVTVGCVTRNPAEADSYRAFDIIEKAFLHAGGRPHWAKRFKADGETLAGLYPKWEDFLRVRREMDPDGKFLNTYLRDIFA